MEIECIYYCGGVGQSRCMMTICTAGVNWWSSRIVVEN